MKKVIIFFPIVDFLLGLIISFFCKTELFFFETEEIVITTIPYIFFNNLKVIISNISGIVTFGITTIVNIFLTAFVLGIHIKRTIELGFDVYYVLFHTLPHFTEYIAIFISGYLGLSGYELILTRKINRQIVIRKIILFLITIPLLYFAAIMEVKFAIN